MATHDYVIDNSTGANVRADINNVLQAVLTNNSNSSSPSTTAAYMLWVDTTANIVKIRNSSNNAWINLFTTAGGVDVDAASVFNEDVTFTGASANIVFDKSDNQLEFADNAKAEFGTGGDFEIFHNGTASLIKSPSHTLFIQATTIDIGNGAGNEAKAKLFDDGAVELYFDNSKKLATLTNGVQITGQEFISEGTIFLEKSGAHHHRILANDTGNDLGFQQSSDTGANTNFTTYLRIKDGGDIALPVDSQNLLIGAGGDLKLFHDGTNSSIQNSTGTLRIRGDEIKLNNSGATENYLVATANGSVELYFDNVKKFETASHGLFYDGTGGDTYWYDGSGSNDLKWLYTDNVKNCFGTGSDLQIYHDGSNSYIANATGTLLLQNTAQTTVKGSTVAFENAAGTEVMLKAIQNSSNELYFDNTKRFETISDGTKIKGHDQLVSEDGNANVYKSVKYANIPTSDNITITLASLATGYGVFRMGGYGNAGQAALGLHIILGGFMTGTAYYQVDVLQNFTHANCSISLAKNAGNYVITVNNTSSSQSLIVSMSLESAGGKMTQTIAY